MSDIRDVYMYTCCIDVHVQCIVTLLDRHSIKITTWCEGQMMTCIRVPVKGFVKHREILRGSFDALLKPKTPVVPISRRSIKRFALAPSTTSIDT